MSDEDRDRERDRDRVWLHGEKRAGARYDRGGGSYSQRVPERVRDYNLAQASGLRQQRIDTGPWTSKGRSSKEILGRAWAKACYHSVAKRLLSQCVSSSGCERNWSTFAFIHTKLRNKLGYLKLHELVFVNYNLRLRIQRATGTPEPSEFDPALAFMDLSLHRHNEAIRDWMERGRSNAPPTLDEDSPISDTPLPSMLFTSLVREQGGTEEVQEWADETIGDTHLGKRKTRLGRSDRKGKRVKITDQIEEEDEDEDSDDNTTDPSAGDDGSHGDAGLYGGGSGAGGSGMGGSGAGDWRSTGGSRFTHSTQDSYHDAPHSQRETISGRRRSVSFPVQDGIRSSSSSGSSNYPTGQDPVYNPYAWQWQPSQGIYGPLHHQAKHHHRSCMGIETMDLLHHHIQIYQICIHQDHNMGMDKFPLHRPITISMTDWINITTLPTCLSTITMTRAEHVSIVK
ncbi:hypothetical protein ZEAMMB73_Zm00001d051604 [Zea mays]|uniref:HAT C-terminal dimerisation domain-containing protein n=1 Tax=Zea mays TaxID=4577 RepID=A0A1D6Q8C3_MAIZE|nr:hypothetical protein ZEAMMB73_Zm00001d051604 [Zea mays]